MVPNACGIYLIRHIDSGRVYVGSAISISARWKNHRTDLRAGRHHSVKLQRAWSKYGEDAFTVEVAQLVGDRKALISTEQKWINQLDAARTGFNVAAKAGASPRGRVQPAEERARRSLAMRGRKLTKEQAASRDAALRSPEVRAKISLAGRNHQKSGAHLDAIREALNTPEVQAKLRARANPMQGVTQSDETRALIRARAQARWADPVLRAMYVQARRARIQGSSP